MNSTITGIIAALLIGVGGGYFAGAGTGSTDAKALQESVSMMKEQSTHVQEMAKLMQSSGTVLQEMGMKYKDEAAVSQGKDLEAVGTKYMKAEADASVGSNTMGKIMQ